MLPGFLQPRVNLFDEPTWTYRPPENETDLCVRALPHVTDYMRVKACGSLVVVTISTIKWQKEPLVGGT